LISSLWVVVVVVVVVLLLLLLLMMMMMVMMMMLMIPPEEISSFGCVRPAAERLVRGLGWLQQAGRRTCLFRNWMSAIIRIDSSHLSSSLQFTEELMIFKEFGKRIHHHHHLHLLIISLSSLDPFEL
jgi:hypothetical protein